MIIYGIIANPLRTTSFEFRCSKSTSIPSLTANEVVKDVNNIYGGLDADGDTETRLEGLDVNMEENETFD